MMTFKATEMNLQHLLYAFKKKYFLCKLVRLTSNTVPGLTLFVHVKKCQYFMNKGKQ